jgi:hypothetical protein
VNARAAANIRSAAAFVSKAGEAVDNEDYERAAACAEVSRAYTALALGTLDVIGDDDA